MEEEALCAATDEALEAMLPILKRYRERLQAIFPNDVGEEDLVRDGHRVLREGPGGHDRRNVR